MGAMKSLSCCTTTKNQMHPSQILVGYTNNYVSKGEICFSTTRYAFKLHVPETQLNLTNRTIVSVKIKIGWKKLLGGFTANLMDIYTYFAISFSGNPLIDLVETPLVTRFDRSVTKVVKSSLILVHKFVFNRYSRKEISYFFIQTKYRISQIFIYV
ncbi:hypothetical protein MXB_1590 [Myxobolus squamalis]|nr:hypothetical protein MXB_1590 [Myxobolus squamalis]